MLNQQLAFGLQSAKPRDMNKIRQHRHNKGLNEAFIDHSINSLGI